MWETVDRLRYYLVMLGIGASATVVISLGAFVLAVVLGFVLTILRQSRGLAGPLFVTSYAEVFRNTPTLTQLLIIYFGLVQVGIVLPSLVAAIIGLGLGGAAVLSEVFRASLLAIDKGQSEAAQSLGMRRLERLRYIVVPQGVRVALPPISNYAIGLLKDTSLASAVAVPELALRARMLVAETYQSTTIYLLVALIYLALSGSLSLLFSSMERRTKWGRA
jgi:His/Glu/Gln/Arg/opine family amino acid ABC transporter permease subunit